ncbi:hypothetical protein V7x_40370 [Crateriforma conspicua]|uniref:Uncharacterized protein n=2 Tax=Crateriforma conspicua TaxID=2527996 RepID=A0A5C6FNS7_9PLAN|nr:hypothetical protein V7x_40370 [Crateriforma conspicua]
MSWVDVDRTDYGPGELPPHLDCPNKIESSCEQDRELILDLDKKEKEVFNGIFNNCQCFARKNLLRFSDYSECMARKRAAGGCKGSSVRVCSRECRKELTIVVSE